MAKSKVHEVVMRIRFDKPCTLAHAVREAKDCIHGEFYPYQEDPDFDPGEFKVVTIKRMPKLRK